MIKQKLPLVIIIIFVLSGAGYCQKATPGNQAKNEEKKSHSDVPLSDREFVIFACVQFKDAMSALGALKKSNIPFFAYTDRGLAGIQIRKQDFERARKILKADAKLHHYNVGF